MAEGGCSTSSTTFSGRAQGLAPARGRFSSSSPSTIDDAELINELELHEARASLARELLDEVVEVDRRAADILRRRYGLNE